ncbi:amino acid ABC transporter permease [Labrenzia sp. CE80]|uniref:amino acid ABC transporter permease n=1 Tax=Labrenzia sp. CE80 TaxID=1788986 RepID=UPI001AD8F7CD|nr:amino acid ABC transporter permease [Labrenzia sp. CE80]
MKDLFVDILGKPFGIVLFQLLDATQFTIYLSLIAFVGGGIIGLLVTSARMARAKSLQRISTAYTWLFQSVPLLMLLFLLGLGMPRLFAINVDPWVAASLALTLYTSAYLSEVWRGALVAIPHGQAEGGKALGLTMPQIFLLIIVPQAFRLAIAPTVGFLVQIIKGTSLAYIIGFHDLMSIGKRWANSPVPGTQPFVIFPLMAMIYFALCFPLSVWSRRLEKRLGSSSAKGGAHAA